MNTKAEKQPIGVMDSGLGGLSVLKEFAYFIVGRLGTLMLDTGIMILAGNYIGTQYIPVQYQDQWGIIIKIFANIIVIVLNYMLSKLVVFKN